MTPGAALAAHDPGGHGLLETERAADGDHPLAHVQLVGVAEARHHQVRRRVVEPHHGHVRLRVLTDDVGAVLLVVVHGDGHLGRALHDVPVGHHVAVGVDDEP